MKGDVSEMFKFEVVDVGDHIGISLYHDGVDVLLCPHFVLFQGDADDIFKDAFNCSDGLYTSSVVASPDEISDHTIFDVA